VASVDPAEGTGSARFAQVVTMTTPLSGKQLVVPALVKVDGHAKVADGRLLTGARVTATPIYAQAPPSLDADPPPILPRPASTTTDPTGAFHLDLDPGSYELAVDPEPGTGLPRKVDVVAVEPVQGAGVVLPDAVVPAPFRRAFTVRAPLQNAPPVAQAIVRFFVLKPGTSSPYVEAGVGITDADGKCEILLAD
jgi:hypothetical protein